MTRSRLWPLLAAIAWVGLSVASPVAAQAAAGARQTKDDETPRANPPESLSSELPDAPTPEMIEDFYRVRRTAIYGLFGFGTPVGVVGLEGVHRFGEWFELTAGFGNGLGAMAAQPNGHFGHALQWAVMPRLRVGNDNNAFTLGAGLSGGEFSGEVLCIGCDDGGSFGPRNDPTHYTLWTNFEIAGEHWSRDGLAIRYFLGLTHGTMFGVPASESSGTLPYLGLGVGYAF